MPSSSLSVLPQQAMGEELAVKDHEDPLCLFTSEPLVACMGDWTSDKLTLRIFAQDGQWMLASGKRELFVKETDTDFEWSVYESSAMVKELYVATIAGCGARTRLTMRPGKQHSGSGKKLELWRPEHKAEEGEKHPGEADERDEAASERLYEQERDAAAARRREDSPGLIGDACDEPRARSDSRKSSRRRGNDTKGGQRRNKKGGKGNGRAEDFSNDRSPDSRDRSRSRSGHGRGHSPQWRGGGSGGKGKRANKDKDGDGEEIMTIFLTGLPEDAREEEVRSDLEVVGDIIKVIVMRRQGERSAFVRFETAREATRAMEKINDGKLRVCDQTRTKAEMARRNTN